MFKDHGENELVSAVREGVEAFRRRRPLRIHHVRITPAPKYSARQIVRIRSKMLNVSQSVFARYLGVSPSTVRAWEQNQRTPSESACRLLQLAERRPEVLQQLAS
jgi:putative transcriptional regulator